MKDAKVACSFSVEDSCPLALVVLLFTKVPIKRIYFRPVYTCCKIDASTLSDCSHHRAVYWVLFVYFGHQSSKKEIDQIGIGRRCCDSPFNLMCSHAIFGNMHSCNMSLLHAQLEIRCFFGNCSDCLTRSFIFQRC